MINSLLLSCYQYDIFMIFIKLLDERKQIIVKCSSPTATQLVCRVSKANPKICYFRYVALRCNGGSVLIDNFKIVVWWNVVICDLDIVPRHYL
jgi:hypothetical protein